MTTKIKRVCVTPLSRKAKNRFANEMDLFHTCNVEIEREHEGQKWWYLQSLNKSYYFWVPAKGNDDWKVERGSMDFSMNHQRTITITRKFALRLMLLQSFLYIALGICSTITIHIVLSGDSTTPRKTSFMLQSTAKRLVV